MTPEEEREHAEVVCELSGRGRRRLGDFLAERNAFGLFTGGSAQIAESATPSGLTAVHRTIEVDCRRDVMPEKWREEGVWQCLPEDQIKSRVQGKVQFSIANLGLVLKLRDREDYITGHSLSGRLELERECVLPDNFLEVLLANPELIPAEYRRGRVGFWGKIYSRRGLLYIRQMVERQGKFTWDCRYVGQDFSASNPVAVFKHL
ncbi:MAG: hypothetical protein A2542_02280 [Parcubacteria group bacterium RIFOXYD2_FULL_52_8]|nr:MAG: hypothetical protein A2542_02280 [Parcubacteria group bacterium RIFOXYD2_FULL_52_8]